MDNMPTKTEQERSVSLRYEQWYIIVGMLNVRAQSQVLQGREATGLALSNIADEITWQLGSNDLGAPRLSS